MQRIPPEITALARAMRHVATDAERKLWAIPRLNRPRFTRQLVVDRFILDFACRTPRIAIEVDGGQHSVSAEEDAARTAYLEGEGRTVLRFWNNDVLQNVDGVMATILVTVAQAATHPPTLSLPGRGR